MEKKEKGKKNIVKLVLNILFWVIIIGVASIWLVDYIRVTKEQSPMFCINKKTHTYDDGTVEECVGLGYKVFEYNRSSISEGRQFGPFFISIKE